MKNLANFAIFQVAWFLCVSAAADGSIWVGVGAAAATVALHLAIIAVPERRAREAGYIVVVGLVGTLLDSGLGALGAIRYPGTDEAWTYAIAPPWIASLWVLFATLPHHSLAWLVGRPALAALLGAIGGPLSFYAGLRMGAVGVGDEPLMTWGALALEYALATPLLLHFARTD